MGREDTGELDSKKILTSRGGGGGRIQGNQTAKRSQSIGVGGGEGGYRGIRQQKDPNP